MPFTRLTAIVRARAVFCGICVVMPTFGYANSPLDDVAQVASGTDFTCVRTTGAAAQCWGRNQLGQLGDGSTAPHWVAEPVHGLASGVSLIAVGARHACALISDGTVRCWGDNSDGQLGNNSTMGSEVPVTVLGGLNNVGWITAGDAHTCAVTVTGAAYCWGKNAAGQLGNGGVNQQSTPVLVSGFGAGISTMDAGGNHTCARTSTGAMACWGANSFGQLGDGTTGINRLIPVAVSGLSSGVVSISVGNEHSCARMANNGIKCWGLNSDGQLGDGSVIGRAVPVDVVNLPSTVVSISAGDAHTCAVTSANTLLCWGDNEFGQLGDQSFEPRSTPVAVADIDSGAFAVSAGGHHSCARLSGGAVSCWGDNREGALGDGHDALRRAPVQVVLSLDSSTLAAGMFNTCTVNSFVGVVNCWGDNRFGQLGLGTTLQRRWPTIVTGPRGGPVLGAYHGCALGLAGRVMCWGGNQYGQLGIGSHQAELSPVILSSLQGVVINNLSAGAAHVCALSDAGGVWCWGANGGALGDGTELERTLPVTAIGMDSHVTALASGYAHSCALKDDGAVWCWGSNSIGQLGDGSLMNRLQPVAVAGLGIAAVSITAGYGHTCALLSDGAIRCWGLNESGQLGDGSFQSSVNPVAVSGVGGSATRVAAGYAHTCATLSSGGVRCWGSNAHAQLGDGTLTDRTTPIGVQGMNAGVTSLAAGGLHTCATRSDGRVWCWGSNQWGQTGDGSAGYQSFPTSAVRSARLFADGFE